MIRPRTESDLPACVALLRLVHDADGYPHTWPDDPDAWLRPERQWGAWVAVADVPDAPTTALPETDAVLGHVAVRRAGGAALPIETAGTGLLPEDLAVVSRLFISPRWRHRGLGSSLLTRAVSAAHESGLQPVLSVHEENREAVVLYERTGWRRIGELELEDREGARLPTAVFAGPPPGGPAPGG